MRRNIELFVLLLTLIVPALPVAAQENQAAARSSVTAGQKEFLRLDETGGADLLNGAGPNGTLSSLPMRAGAAPLYPGRQQDPHNPEAAAENTGDAPGQDDPEQRERR